MQPNLSDLNTGTGKHKGIIQIRSMFFIIYQGSANWGGQDLGGGHHLHVKHKASSQNFLLGGLELRKSVSFRFGCIHIVLIEGLIFYISTTYVQIYFFISSKLTAGLKFSKIKDIASWPWLLYILRGSKASRKCHIITNALIQ